MSNATSITLKPSTSNKFSSLKRPTHEILRRLLVHSDGRDKFLKIIQYFGKIILWTHIGKNKSKYPKLYPRLIAMTSQFSNTRKIIRLAHFLEPYSDLNDYVTGARNPSSIVRPYEKFVYYLGFINSITSILNDFFDDLYCLGKVGILDKSVAKRAEPIAIKLWFLNIIMDIHEVIFRICLVKLSMDFSFCGYDLFECTFSDGVQAVTGFVAGMLSFRKLWVKEAYII
ncbi:19993_t:CDS:2 [Rhizophagus irregularis]|nr:19993_t:CDS:2 [Rhizophagus irregularis]